MASGSNPVHITLGPLDHVAPHNIPQSVLYLSLKQDVKAADAFAHLQEGLRLTFLQLPWLSGSVHRQSEETPGWRCGQLEIRYGQLAARPYQLRFNELDTRKLYSNLRETGFPLDAFDDEAILWPTPFEPDFHTGVDVFVAQANFLPGGCLLALSIAAPASDGTAMLTVTKLWADHCSSILQTQNDDPVDSTVSLPLPSETSDRANLDRILTEEGAANLAGGQQDRETSPLLGLGSEVHGTANAPEPLRMKHCIFYMPHTAYTTLRKGCVAEFGTTDISGNDIVCALIWRSLMRAWTVADATHHTVKVRDHGPIMLAELFMPFDARPHFAQSLPASYLGNMNYENRVTMPLDTLVASHTSISSVAQTIRTYAASQATRDVLLDVYAKLRTAPDFSRLQLQATRAVRASVGILSPIVLPFNDTCFGDRVFGNGGKPDAFRPMMGSCNRGFHTCFVIPRKKHGGLEFVMTLSDKEMEFLNEDDEFNRYAFPLG
ncbi:MAG: hypothetical protein Q9201_001259 [Fulgogasparrea decipioides]